jgi:hypothetical protein
MARVELRELVRRGRNHLETAPSVAIDANDEDACVALLRTMAKKHRKNPANCEISVKSGTRAKIYRIPDAH